MHTITLKHHILELKLISTTKHTSHSLISFCGHTFMSNGGFKGVLHLFYTSGVCLQVFGSTAAYVKEVVGYKTFPQLQRLSRAKDNKLENENNLWVWSSEEVSHL